MLHNTGQFGSDVPMNVNPQTNMTSMNDRMNIDNNINNLGKIAHPQPQPSSHFNLPDYGTYGLNMNTNLSHFQNFHPIGFQPSNIAPNPMHDSWQTSMLPMNLNMHSDQHSMLGYQYGKPDPYTEHKEHSVNKTLNIPQVQTKAFHKQMGMDAHNYQCYKPNFRQYTDYSLHMNAKSKPDLHKQMDGYSHLDKERLVSPRPTYYEQNIDLSNKPQKMLNIFSSPYQSPEINVPLNNHENGGNQDNLDLSAKLQKYTPIVQKPLNTYEEPVLRQDVIPQKTVEPSFSDNLNIPKPQNLETNLTPNYPYISSDLGKGFLKDQDSRRRSLENTVKMIENILSHSSNSRKSDYISQDSPSDDRGLTDKTKSNLRESEASVSNSSQALNSQSNSPSPSNYSNDESSQESTNVSNDKMDTEDENITKTDTNTETANTDNSNNENDKAKTGKDSQSASDEESSDSEDVKPPLMTDNNASTEHEIIIDNSVIIKVEVVPSIVDMEHLNPFHRDIFGIQNEDVANNDIIDSESSINVAKEVIRNGASVKGAFFECPHCNLYFNHPKRFLIHTKWHSFGLTNEKRLELQKEKEMRRNMRKEARVVERMNQSEVTDVNTPGRKFSCKDCDKVFNAKASLKNHKQRYHPTRSRDCKICGKTLTGWMALRAHLATHTSDSGYQCSDCPKRFKHPHSLAKHRDTHLEKTHGCAQCPKKFGSRALLNVHMKTHERVLRGATFRCTYCGKGFFEAYSLQVHERTHRNERPFLCEICNTSFGTNSSLKRHLKVSHSTSKPFECSTCHRSFISEAIRDRHSLRNHGNPEDFKFLCKQCPCKYLKLKDLRKHMYKVHPKGKRKKKVQSDSE
ncbi:zinc finger protein 37-like [Vanessa atalanta]|uniref:zinc finger protein 37-like n=1 Tax=Vanessa atalanta TaxID=42275 RepID=UPI001FCDEBE2|nr:zinc finger protein 37-like [Vanessa atalanta]